MSPQVMCHMPAVCEEKSLPYVYTPSRYHLPYKNPHKIVIKWCKNAISGCNRLLGTSNPPRQDLGTAMGVKRGCLMVMVSPAQPYTSLIS